MTDTPITQQEQQEEQQEQEKEKYINYVRDPETNELIEVENAQQIAMLNEFNLGMTFSIGLVLCMALAVLSAAYSIYKLGD